MLPEVIVDLVGVSSSLVAVEALYKAVRTHLEKTGNKLSQEDVRVAYELAHIRPHKGGGSSEEVGLLRVSQMIPFHVDDTGFRPTEFQFAGFREDRNVRDRAAQ